MTKTRLPSLKTFAGQEDPFAEIEALKRRLLSCSSESRYLEWKAYPPIGPSVNIRLKYRAVKAAISFANTDGGFIVFGVARDGCWVGFTVEELSNVDPSKITELINGCISPDLPYFNYTPITYRGKHFSLLHIPASPLMPHVTTKEVVERPTRSKQEIILARNAVYYRSGGRTGLASPDQHQKIVMKRTDFLRTELLRRIREVPIAVPSLTGSKVGEEGDITYTRQTDDPRAPVVRLTRDITQASGVFLHEQLSEGLFEEINNVLEANSLLSAGRGMFLFGEPVYCRIYAERQHIKGNEQIALLARTAFTTIYGPHLFWFLVMPPELGASIIIESLKQIKHPYVNALVRLVALLGPETSDWLWGIFQDLWKRHTQKPAYYWLFKKIRSRTGTLDRRLKALNTTGRSTIDVPSEARTITIKEAMENRRATATLLSKACMKIFQGEKQWRSTARVLDVLTYGPDIESRGREIFRQFKKFEEVKLAVKDST